MYEITGDLHIGVPRVCGGDPAYFMYITKDGKVFPVYAGVIL
nr:MAG TPA: hypothetical protein [Caudoviricetes sp.]